MPTETSLGYLVRPIAEAPTVPCPCGQSTRALTRADTPVCNFHITFIQDSVRHYHRHCTEVYYILEGQGKMELNDETWHVVKETPKVTGFVGGSTNPPPVSDEEVRAITQQMEEGAVKPKPRVLFTVGENVKVVDGPFADFNGVVEEVKPDKGKLRVLISIFGRATPVELEFVQVERN